MANLSVTAASVVAGDNGIFDGGLAGEAIAAGDQVYLDATTKKWQLADANAAGAEARQAKGTALNGAALNQPLKVQKDGDITIGATLTAGTAYFLSDTPGKICPFADVGTGEYVCLIGIAKTTAVLMLVYKYPGVSL